MKFKSKEQIQSVIDEIAEDTVEQDTVINEPVPEEKSATSEEELRRKIEEELREKILSEAREKMNAEAEELRREREKLLFENERLMAIARKAEEDRMQESEALRREIQARERAEFRSCKGRRHLLYSCRPCSRHWKRNTSGRGSAKFRHNLPFL